MLFGFSSVLFFVVWSLVLCSLLTISFSYQLQTRFTARWVKVSIISLEGFYINGIIAPWEILFYCCNTSLYFPLVLFVWSGCTYILSEFGSFLVFLLLFIWALLIIIYFFLSIWSGTFGQVLECWDRERREMVAIKIVRGIKKYREAAMIEIDMLQQLGKHDKNGAR